jgi:hypothetical protein
LNNKVVNYIFDNYIVLSAKQKSKYKMRKYKL